MGAGLGRDGITAVCQMQRVACIASKPAPTGRDGPGVVGAGLGRDGGTAVGQMHRVACIASKPAPTGRDGPGVVGAGLARDGGHCGLPDAARCLHREQARSRRGNAGAVVGQMAQPRTTAGRFAWALITSPSSRMPGAISSWAMEPKPRRRQGRGRVSGSTQNALLGSNSTPLANPA